jgi:hypothetical protein
MASKIRSREAESRLSRASAWSLAAHAALEFGFGHADVAQLVERKLPKLEVAGSRPVVRSPLE